MHKALGLFPDTGGENWEKRCLMTQEVPLLSRDSMTIKNNKQTNTHVQWFWSFDFNNQKPEQEIYNDSHFN